MLDGLCFLAGLGTPWGAGLSGWGKGSQVLRKAWFMLDAIIILVLK